MRRICLAAMPLPLLARAYAGAKPPAPPTGTVASFGGQNVDASKLQHPYWEKGGGVSTFDDDDLLFMDELGGEYGSEFDFDLPEVDKPYLQNEWKKDEKKD